MQDLKGVELGESFVTLYRRRASKWPQFSTHFTWRANKAEELPSLFSALALLSYLPFTGMDIVLFQSFG